MPSLKNGKHERYCQAYVKGNTAGNQVASYSLVYGKNPKLPATRSAASRLHQNVNVLNRVAQLQNAAEAIEATATERLVDKVVATKEWILAMLVENAERSMQAQPVMNQGIATGEFKYDGNVANRALELLGKNLGMFVDRRSVPGEFDGLTPDELDRRISELERELRGDAGGAAQVSKTATSPRRETTSKPH